MIQGTIHPDFRPVARALERQLRRAPAGGGAGAWACPDRKLAVALVLDSGFGTPFGDMRTAEIGGAALRCANRLAAA